MSGTTVLINCPHCEAKRVFNLPQIITCMEDYTEEECSCGATFSVETKMIVEIVSTPESEEEKRKAFLYDSRER